jgi:hypothetical protein
MARTRTRQLMGDQGLVHQPLVPVPAAAVVLGPKRHRTGVGQRAAVGGLRERGPIDQRSRVGRAWGPGRPGCHRRLDQDIARAAAPVLDLGSGCGAGPARPAADRHRPAGVLLRPAQPLAAWHQREQRPAAPVPPQGTDLSKHTTGDLTAVATALNSRPARPSTGNTRRGPRRATVEPVNNRRCCDDPLNQSSSRLAIWCSARGPPSARAVIA